MLTQSRLMSKLFGCCYLCLLFDFPISSYCDLISCRLILGKNPSKDYCGLFMMEWRSRVRPCNVEMRGGLPFGVSFGHWQALAPLLVLTLGSFTPRKKIVKLLAGSFFEGVMSVVAVSGGRPCPPKTWESEEDE